MNRRNYYETKLLYQIESPALRIQGVARKIPIPGNRIKALRLRNSWSIWLVSRNGGNYFLSPGRSNLHGEISIIHLTCYFMEVLNNSMISRVLVKGWVATKKYIKSRYIRCGGPLLWLSGYKSEVMGSDPRRVTNSVVVLLIRTLRSDYQKIKMNHWMARGVVVSAPDCSQRLWIQLPPMVKCLRDEQIDAFVVYKC